MGRFNKNSAESLKADTVLLCICFILFNDRSVIEQDNVSINDIVFYTYGNNIFIRMIILLLIYRFPAKK